jgi:hypothetical protein
MFVLAFGAALLPAAAQAQGWRDRLKKAAGSAAGATGAGEALDGVRMAKRMKEATDLMRRPAPVAGTYALTVIVGSDTAHAVFRTTRTGRMPFMADTAFTDDVNDTDENRSRPGWMLTGVAAVDSADLPGRLEKGAMDDRKHGGVMLWTVPTTDVSGATRLNGSALVTFGEAVGDPAARRVWSRLRAISAEFSRPDGKSMTGRAAVFLRDASGALTLSQRLALSDGTVVTVVARRLSEAAYD